MSCRPQCFVPAFLGSIAMLVMICVPIYYFVAVYRPDLFTGKHSLPYENDFIKIYNGNNQRILIDILRDSTTVLSLEIHSMGPDTTVRILSINYYTLIGVKGQVDIDTSIYGNDVRTIQIWHTWQIYSPEGIQDCFELRPNEWSWYGGPSQHFQYWPIEKLRLKDYSYYPKREDHASVAERYWLNSAGAFIFVPHDVPLFVDQNTNDSRLCLTAKNEEPYMVDYITLKYTIGVGSNARDAHMQAVRNYLDFPKSHPDERMVRHPVWSTWARYKENVNETAVLQLANEIETHGFQHSQIEIDDNWEQCYGTLNFDETKFPDIKNLTDQLKARGFRTTLWIHPFINRECKSMYAEANDNGFLVANQYGEEGMEWWQSKPNGAAHIDFTKVEAANWFLTRVRRLHRVAGIDSFKFDAGESSWIPKKSVLQIKKNVYPSELTTIYVNTVSNFGPMVEVRSGFRTQSLPIFTRMWDLDSVWTWDNGLPNFITKLLQLNMVGYGFVLPDMVGGNGYHGVRPDKELFIRWVQANVFMPAIQFSYVPWDFDSETIAICKQFTKLHADYTNTIIHQFKMLTLFGEPVNPPIWWIDPNDRTAQQIYDEFLLGDKILAAPVIEQGATTRHVYLPKGTWIDGNTNETIYGPRWLMDYPAPLNVLPYFLLSNVNIN